MDFDPYETWLGIPADRRPPTYYDLLGLAPYESDPATIEQAALRRMGKVRQHQIGPHSDLSQEILAELARARLILMDPDRRADYDAKLRARGESRPGPWAAPAKVGNGDAPRHRPGPRRGCPRRLRLPRPHRASRRRPVQPVLRLERRARLVEKRARRSGPSWCPMPCSSGPSFITSSVHRA